MGVGTFIGNIIGLVLIVVAALFGFVSLEASAIALIAISYTAWLFVTVSNLLTRPKRDVGLGTLLSDAEFDVYRRYHTYLWFPGGGEMFSSALNLCRIGGFIWAGLCIWQGHYWLAAALIAFFFVSGSIILKTNPALYVGRPASQGNAFAIEQLSLLEDVQMKRQDYNLDSDSSHHPDS